MAKQDQVDQVDEDQVDEVESDDLGDTLADLIKQREQIEQQIKAQVEPRLDEIEKELRQINAATGSNVRLVRGSTSTTTTSERPQSKSGVRKQRTWRYHPDHPDDPKYIWKGAGKQPWVKEWEASGKSTDDLPIYEGER